MFATSTFASNIGTCHTGLILDIGVHGDVSDFSKYEFHLELVDTNSSSIDQYMSVCTQGLIETLGSMVIFDENQGCF